MSDAFDIDTEKDDCHRLNHNIKIVAQNLSMAKLALSDHIWSMTKDGPSMLAFLLAIKDLVLATTMQQTQE